MSAPQGFGSGGGLSPTTFLGTYSGSNPSSPANGYWWYRVDLGQIWANVNGSIIPIQSTGAVAIISSNTAIANTDVFNDIIVLPNVTLTIYGNIVFHGNVTILNGATLLSSNPNASSTASQTNNYSFLGNFYLNGTYEIAQYNTDNINSNLTIAMVLASAGANPTISGSGTLNIPSTVTITLNINLTYLGSPSLSGSGTLSIGSGYTLTINTNITWTFNLSGSGSISISSGYTLTIGANITVSNITIAGSGTLNVSSGYTLTVSANITLSISTISGSGTLSVSSGYTLTQGASITLSVSTVNIAGTWANAGYGITIPSGSTVTITITGSFTTASTPGTITVDGTCYWFGAMSPGTTGLPSFPLSIAGSGILVGSPSNSSSGGNSISLSSSTLSANGTSGGATGTGIAPYYKISSLSGSAIGKYALGNYNATATTYVTYVLIYIGTANTSFSINSSLIFTNGSEDIYGDGFSAYNSSGSAGTITITGTLYV